MLTLIKEAAYIVHKNTIKSKQNLLLFEGFKAGFTLIYQVPFRIPFAL